MQGMRLLADKAGKMGPARLFFGQKLPSSRIWPCTTFPWVFAASKTKFRLCLFSFAMVVLQLALSDRFASVLPSRYVPNYHPEIYKKSRISSGSVVAHFDSPFPSWRCCRPYRAVLPVPVCSCTAPRISARSALPKFTRTRSQATATARLSVG